MGMSVCYLNTQPFNSIMCNEIPLNRQKQMNYDVELE